MRKKLKKEIIEIFGIYPNYNSYIIPRNVPIIFERLYALEKYLGIEYKGEPDNQDDYPKYVKIKKGANNESKR